MEGQDDYLLESSNQVDASELSTSEPSRTLDDNIIKDEDISPESLQSKPRMEHLSKILDVVEISSDDELEIIDVSKGQSEAPERKNEQNQHSSGRTSPQDVTCSVCLGEYDNKAFLDKCFRILFILSRSLMAFQAPLVGQIGGNYPRMKFVWYLYIYAAPPSPPPHSTTT